MVRVQADLLPQLRAALQSETVGAEVRADLPNNWTVDSQPALVLADDGGPLQWPIKSRNTIRITGWGKDRVAVRRMVARAVGTLHDARLPRLVVSRSSSAVIEARDKTTGAWLASALMTITARTTEV
jgi:hypothetical protein